jgi:Family of unknown function (DUF6524)
MTAFSLSSFLFRFFGAVLVVLLTFNPTGYSYYHWLIGSTQNSGLGALHAFAGVVLLIGWTVLIRSSYRSLGALGVLLAAAFIGTLVWLLADFELINTASSLAVTWAALVSLAALLAIGMSWSHIRKRISGQIDVDDLTE